MAEEAGDVDALELGRLTSFTCWLKQALDPIVSTFALLYFLFNRPVVHFILFFIKVDEQLHKLGRSSDVGAQVNDTESDYLMRLLILLSARRVLPAFQEVSSPSPPG